MSFIGSAVLTTGLLGAGSAAYQAHQAGNAADAQVKGNNAAIAEQRRQFDAVMQMLAPQQQFGNNALNSLNRLYGYGNLSTGAQVGQNPLGTGAGQIGSTGIGINPLTGGVQQGVGLGPQPGQGPASQGFAGGVGNIFGQLRQANAPYQPPGMPGIQQQGAPDMSVFFQSPDYQFRQSEGMKNIQNSLAARGGAMSGNALKALNEFNSNLASGEFGNFVQRQLSMAGLGGQATNNATNAAQYTGGAVGNLLSNNGNARASGITNSSNAWGGLFNGLGSMAGYFGG